ncbi:MAG: hypothetical protein IPL07_11565 [Acidimicrobiaceae bacterium]|nr:hypothetical protein [Acidimicrobiaceae bacterium]
MSQIRRQLIAMIDDALGDDPRRALVAAHSLSREIDWLQQKAVALARVNGWGWGRIGRLLGITRQGARKKFPLAPPAPPPHVVAADRYLKEQREGERLVERFRNGTLSRPEEEDPVFW